MRLLLVAVVALAIAACASIGRPEGGPRDETPPVFVKSTPAVGAVNFSGNKLTIEFDENVQVKDVLDKVVVSPAQKTMPSISAQAKKVTVELRDTMLDNTTYTIDFSDAISDLNESNALDGFTIDFSTGEQLDSLRISGMVFEARNLEPAQGMLVGVYSNLSDTAITTLQFERIAKTNQLGQFTIRNLKPGTYRIYAVNDMNRDLHWDRSEDVAFYDVVVSPESQPTEVADTLTASDGSDSIVVRPATLFLPNDVLLTWFNEGYKAQYLKDYKRVDRHRITFDFAAPSDTLPEITILNGELSGRRLDECAVLNTGETKDTLEYWIRDTTLIAQDTIVATARYLRTDTLQQLSWGTDTLKIILKGEKNKEKEKEKKKDKKKKKDDEDEQTDSVAVPEITFLAFNATSSPSHNIYAPVTFSTNQPIDSIDAQKIHLEIKNDTLWDTIAAPELKLSVPTKLLAYEMRHKWAPGMVYRITIDSAAVFGIYNEWNNKVKHEFTVKSEEEYSILYFNIPNAPDSLIVELLSSSDEPVRTALTVGGIAEFLYVDPGTYYARAYIDANGNGKYDTGNIASKTQPEEVFYYSKKINVKKNWDIEQNWDIYALPIDQQKPNDIKKNKPKKKRGETDSGESSDEEEDEYGDGFDTFGPGNNSNRGGFGGFGGNGIKTFNGSNYAR